MKNERSIWYYRTRPVTEKEVKNTSAHWYPVKVSKAAVQRRMTQRAEKTA